MAETTDAAGAPNLPRHIAVIPDGNRRWARQRGLPAIAGHKEGVENYRRLLAMCGEKGIRYVTFYAFSTENWKRSEQEVNGLMGLMVQYMRNFDRVMGKNKSRVRFLVSGDRSRLAPSVQQGIAQIERETRDNSDLTAVICINYGGREEILQGTRSLMREATAGKWSEDAIAALSERDFSGRLYQNLPDPDLLIRTSGEERISNFLLWQLAYAELYFTDVYWPDFGEQELDRALDAYAKRQRRFGN